MAEGAAAEVQRTSSHHHSKAARQVHGPPRTGLEQRQGQPAAPLPPYQPPMFAHIQQMPRYRRLRGSQPNPEAETVSAYSRVRVRSRPRSPRTHTAQDYEHSPGPTSANSPHDPTTHTHAHGHTSAQGQGPSRRQWWQRWTHTQLWELQKWARTEPSLEGLVRWPCRGSAENCRLQPAEDRMPQAASEAMLADALHTQRVHPRQLPAPQDQRYVLSRLRKTLQAKPREGRRMWDILSSPPPHMVPPPGHPASVDARTVAALAPPRPAAQREPLAPHNRTRLRPRPTAPPPNPTEGTTNQRYAHLPRPSQTKPEAPARPTTATLPAGRAAPGPAQPDYPPSVTPCSDRPLPATQQATAAENHAEPRPEEATPIRSQWTPTRAPRGTRCTQRHRTQGCSRHNREIRQSNLALAEAK